MDRLPEALEGSMILNVLRHMNSALVAIKLDLRLILASLREIPRYISDRRAFSVGNDAETWPLGFLPVLLDRESQSASLGEYFWQDLFVAKEILTQNPKRHIDVGSRIDGFVAHLACARHVEVFDLRPLETRIENVSFVQWDITHPNTDYHEVADCVSCLHTLEHIGLGRYGDALDPESWRSGLMSLAGLIAPGGVLWLSVPIGIQCVKFNAHRIFNPITVVNEAENLGLVVGKFFHLGEGGVKQSDDWEGDMKYLSSKKYCLGIFLFEKRI